MSLADTAAVAARLQSEFGYPAKGATNVAIRLGRLTPPLAAEAERWWSTGEEVSLEVHGHNVASLRARHGLNVIAAILTLDWILREPAVALPQIERGHDSLR